MIGKKGKKRKKKGFMQVLTNSQNQTLYSLELGTIYLSFVFQNLHEFQNVPFCIDACLNTNIRSIPHSKQSLSDETNDSFELINFMLVKKLSLLFEVEL